MAILKDLLVNGPISTSQSLRAGTNLTVGGSITSAGGITTGGGILSIGGEIHSTFTGNLGNYTSSKYTLTATDGISGFTAGTSGGELTLPALGGNSRGRVVWVAVPATVSIPVTVKYTDYENKVITTIVGTGQAATFICNAGITSGSTTVYTWTCMTPCLASTKTLAGDTYTLSYKDSFNIISGYSGGDSSTAGVIFPAAAGWEGREVKIIAQKGTIYYKAEYYKASATAVSYTGIKSVSPGNMNILTFSNGGWAFK